MRTATAPSPELVCWVCEGHGCSDGTSSSLCMFKSAGGEWADRWVCRCKPLWSLRSCPGESSRRNQSCFARLIGVRMCRLIHVVGYASAACWQGVRLEPAFYISLRLVGLSIIGALRWRASSCLPHRLLPHLFAALARRSRACQVLPLHRPRLSARSSRL